LFAVGDGFVSPISKAIWPYSDFFRSLFSPCGFFGWNFVQIVRLQGLKPYPFWPRVARLKSCPDTKQKTLLRTRF